MIRILLELIGSANKILIKNQKRDEQKDIAIKKMHSDLTQIDEILNQHLTRIKH